MLFDYSIISKDVLIKSTEFPPIIISKTPGSIIGFKSLSKKESISGVILNLTVFFSPGIK